MHFECLFKFNRKIKIYEFMERSNLEEYKFKIIIFNLVTLLRKYFSYHSFFLVVL